MHCSLSKCKLTTGLSEGKVPMTYVIEGAGALVNEKGEETPLKAGDFALVNPSEKHQCRNKGDKAFKMICGVPKEFE
jgi:quercetin dioxygenase-like cupin family protein